MSTTARTLHLTVESTVYGLYRPLISKPFKSFKIFGLFGSKEILKFLHYASQSNNLWVQCDSDEISKFEKKVVCQ